MRTFVVPLLAAVAALAAPGALRAELIYGLTTSNSLVSFDSATPGVVTAPVAITGLVNPAGEAVVGLDTRPADGALVILTRQEVATAVFPIGRGRVYTVDPLTGAATLINPRLTAGDVIGTEVLLSDTDPNSYSIDFNPVVNALRIVGGNTDQNLRILGGGSGGVIVDTPVDLPAGAERVDGVAYDNNVAGAASTTLYAINTEPNQLQTIGSVGGSPTSPNTGLLLDTGPLGLSPLKGSIGFDVSGATGVAYASLRPAATLPHTLYSVDLSSGQVSSLGAIGVAPGTLRDLTVAGVPEPASLTLLAAGAVGLAGFAVRRKRRATA